MTEHQDTKNPGGCRRDVIGFVAVILAVLSLLGAGYWTILVFVTTMMSYGDTGYLYRSMPDWGGAVLVALPAWCIASVLVIVAIWAVRRAIRAKRERG